MTEILLALATLSIGGAVAVVAFSVAARVSRSRYAARWRCWIWLLLCLRLLIPASFFGGDKTAHSAPIQITTPSDTVEIEINIPDVPGQAEDEVPPTVMPSDAIVGTPVPGTPLEPQYGTPVSDGAKLVLTLSDLLALIWAAGTAVMLVWLLVSHLRFVRYVRRWSRPVEDPDAIRMFNQLGDRLGLDRRPDLRICSGLKAPMLAGIFRPRLLLPENPPAGEELRYTLIHELTHYKRRDIWLKGIAMLTNAVHWFNPFLWYMVRLVERDTELACDEAALRRLPAENHAAYGRTILNAVERLKLK